MHHNGVASPITYRVTAKDNYRGEGGGGLCGRVCHASQMLSLRYLLFDWGVSFFQVTFRTLWPSRHVAWGDGGRILQCSNVQKQAVLFLKGKEIFDLKCGGGFGLMLGF